MTSLSTAADFIEWAVAARPLPGEQESGDLHVVMPFGDGALLAVIDALGHGREAAAAARVAAATLRSQARASVESLMQHCHQQLRSTRGVVMSIASFDAPARRVTWLGIGNVDGYLIRAMNPRHESIVPRGGVVGFQLPILRATTIDVTPGDTLLFATDGIASEFIERRYQGSPQVVADDILARYGKATDDALVLVARFEGARP